MVDDWSNIGLRLALYVDLMILFGVPLFAASALGARDHDAGTSRPHSVLAAGAAVLGAALSLLGLLQMAKQMTGAGDYASISGHVLQMILTRTGAGMAWVVRAAALAACVAAVAGCRSQPRLRFLALTTGGAVALSTLAWTGHGAMDEGARGLVHLSSDVLHLIAAGAWVGALVAFVAMPAGTGMAAPQAVALLARTASGFARMGTVIVVVLTVTGTINYLLVVGPSLQGMVSTVYGRLLAAKLALFAAMLGFAASNRWRLTPQVEAALRRGEHRQAAGALRRSLRGEAALALVLLALVAWLGTLSPDA